MRVRKLLIAASGTGGHLFPALALAQQLPDYQIEWLGVRDRMDTQVIPPQYNFNAISVQGFQKPLGISSIKTAWGLAKSVWEVRSILKGGKFDAVFTTGGYIAAPAILAARSLSIPSVIHESNALPGKVTRLLGRLSSRVAIGFKEAKRYLGGSQTVWVGTPVRKEFSEPQTLDLPIPPDVPLIVVSGGSQGAIAINQLVRQAASSWIESGAWIVHQTGKNDPDSDSFKAPQYINIPFFQNMAALLQRANLVISRAGAGTLSELAITQTPSILIPYPYAANNHQVYNADSFVKQGAAMMFRQADLTVEVMTAQVIHLLKSPDKLQHMSQQAASLAIPDSAIRLKTLVDDLLKDKS